MIEALIEFFVLGTIPGTEFVIGYKTSLAIAGTLVMGISLYATLRYKYFVARRIAELAPDKIVKLKTI